MTFRNYHGPLNPPMALVDGDSYVGELTKVLELVPTSDGTGTGTFQVSGTLPVDVQAIVTSGGVNNIIILPDLPVGSKVTLYPGGSTGYEIRSHATATVGINGGTDTAGESAIAGSTTVWLERVSATNWNGWSRVANGTLSVVQVAAN